MRIPMFACAVLVAGFASADSDEVRAVVTFDHPVEIPGRVLPAGVYVFTMSPFEVEEPQILRIFDASGEHPVATIMTVAEREPGPAKRSIAKYENSSAGEPSRLVEFVFKGSRYGHRFVYQPVP
jgi:hypothetical protein